MKIPVARILLGLLVLTGSAAAQEPGAKELYTRLLTVTRDLDRLYREIEADASAELGRVDRREVPAIDFYFTYSPLVGRRALELKTERFREWFILDRLHVIEWIRPNLRNIERNLALLGDSRKVPDTAIRDEGITAFRIGASGTAPAVLASGQMTWFIEEFERYCHLVATLEAYEKALYMHYAARIAAQERVYEKWDERIRVEARVPAQERIDANGALTPKGAVVYRLLRDLDREDSILKALEQVASQDVDVAIARFKEILKEPPLPLLDGLPKLAVVVIGDIQLRAQNWLARWAYGGERKISGELRMAEAAVEAVKDLRNRGYIVRSVLASGGTEERSRMENDQILLEFVANPQFRAFAFFSHGTDKDGDATIWVGSPIPGKGQHGISPSDVKNMRRNQMITEVLLIHACNQGGTENAADWRREFNLDASGTFHSWNRGVKAEEVFQWQSAWK